MKTNQQQTRKKLNLTRQKAGEMVKFAISPAPRNSHPSQTRFSEYLIDLKLFAVDTYNRTASLLLAVTPQASILNPLWMLFAVWASASLQHLHELYH
ncbi:hypothetical protein [Argonema antarcticum]|uniref:hypothetical protein n=1 Tax=Argonema antarcticum TaxID=2942763 RepID=UPI002011DE14|nr:hypothetical protein [Argonema antarcticum]MCL1471944.1 hypothetical protein [Argonema antarcticum A004/B2]